MILQEHAQCLFRPAPIVECDRVEHIVAMTSLWPLIIIGVLLAGLAITVLSERYRGARPRDDN
jgi:hypothetical protein